MTIDVLVVTGGHPFEPDPFFAMFESFEEVEWSAATTPETGHDVVVLYDMPGYRFTGDPRQPVRFVDPTSAARAVIQALTDKGTGLVVLHHAVAGWPTWPEYGALIGARFHYQPARWAEHDLPDSGYLLDVEHQIEVIAADHPVCADIDTTFALVDELYCFPVDEARVTPLLRTTHPTTADRFFSADHAIRGRMQDRTGWTHPLGSDLVGWVKSAGSSPLVYLQPGDGPTAYRDPSYRRLVLNALRWTSSAQARAWASAQRSD